ncbi:GNAT family N-acetyltransferase [Thalassotalea maritima]|uniref:GNAT family N-acetyltransferase n=1 Tax=Thalassotalea maritima TaxID=3242416 RepID=UPI003527EC32
MQAIAQQVAIKKQRLLLFAIGDSTWHKAICDDILNAQMLTSKPFEVCIYDETLPDAKTGLHNGSTVNVSASAQKSALTRHVSDKTYRQSLGRECQHLFFYAGDDFHVDAFAALSGTVMQGGLAIILISPKAINDSCFLQYLLECCQHHNGAELIEQQPKFSKAVSQFKDDISLPVASIPQKNSLLLPSSSAPISLTEQQEIVARWCISDEQYYAVQCIVNCVNNNNTEHRRYREQRYAPLVVTADRGRGKSSALAIACAQLALTNMHHARVANIVVTAPHTDNLQVFFRQLNLCFPKLTWQSWQLEYGQTTIQFVPIDVLLREPRACDLLLVDEAAGIPVPMLSELVEGYKPVVFSSTIHGYEGAGRGFSQKFLTSLRERFATPQLLHLKHPVRWASNDLLEQFCFDALLLNADVNDDVNKQIPQSRDIVEMPGEHLLNDVDLLRQVFALLVTAHYQTKPSDLKMLLDNPDVYIQLLRTGKQVVAVSLILVEGDIDNNLVEDIKRGVRRPKGHLLPQSLLTHCGFPQAFEYRYARIVRIAVHPSLQRQGLGHQLLKANQEYANRLGADVLGSSFGINEELGNFWFDNRFSLARIGFTKDKASGEHSAMVIKGLTARGKQFCQAVQHQFGEDFDFYLGEELIGLQPEVQQLIADVLAQQAKQTMLSMRACQSASLSDNADVQQNDENAYRRDTKACIDFINGARVYSSCAPAMYRLLSKAINEQLLINLNQTEQDILVAKLIDRKSWPELSKMFNLPGRKACIKALKLACQSLLAQNNKGI